MGRQKIRQLTPNAWSVAILACLAVVVLLFWTGYHFLQPIPPKTLVIATGMEGGSYVVFGERYRKVLARDGIRVIFQPTSGALENLKLLQDPRGRVQAGFMQDGAGLIDEQSSVVSLGGICYTPLWIFYRGSAYYNDLNQLEGKRIALGPEGSGVRKYSLALLKIAGVTSPPAEFIDLPSSDAYRALRSGAVDAVMTFAAPDNESVQKLLQAKDIRLLNLSRAEAYARRIPDFSHVVLPGGVVDPARREPPSDVHLLSPTTDLIVRKDLHPALVYLLLKAAVEIHRGASWVNEAGEFPTLVRQACPVSDQAQRFYRSGPSWIYSYLPFWAATFVERLTLILISLGMIIVPLIGIAPWVYTWRNRKKYYPLYRELMKLEKEILERRPAANMDAYAARLDRMEETVSRMRMSVAFYDELFILKQHIRMVRKKLREAS